MPMMHFKAHGEHLGGEYTSPCGCPIHLCVRERLGLSEAQREQVVVGPRAIHLYGTPAAWRQGREPLAKIAIPCSANHAAHHYTRIPFEFDLDIPEPFFSNAPPL